MDWQASWVENRDMTTNWISRLTAVLRRPVGALQVPSYQLGRADEAWSLDSDGRRLRHELDAMRSRHDGKMAR
jgi:hypothetical protein